MASSSANLILTVLMPAYNAESTIVESIESVLSQSFTDFEFLIINDGSTDRTVEIVKSYSDKRIRLVTNDENEGLIASLNHGFDIAQGKYIIRQDADDISLANRFRIMVHFMELNKDIVLAGSGYDHWEDGKQVAKAQYSDERFKIRLKHLHQIHLCHGTAIFRTSVFREKGLKFNPEFKHAEDYELFVRVAERFPVANVQQCLYRIKQSGSNVSKVHSAEQAKNSMLIKQRQFEIILNRRVSVEEIELFRRIAQYDYPKDIETLNKVARLMCEMVVSNTQTEYFKEGELEFYLSELWFHCCLNGPISGQHSLWKSFKPIKSGGGWRLWIKEKFNI